MARSLVGILLFGGIAAAALLGRPKAATAAQQQASDVEKQFARALLEGDSRRALELGRNLGNAIDRELFASFTSEISKGRRLALTPANWLRSAEEFTLDRPEGVSAPPKAERLARAQFWATMLPGRQPAPQGQPLETSAV